MLSKAVRLRRRINRERRKQPAWRSCMQNYKQSQLTFLKLSRNAQVGATGSHSIDSLKYSLNISRSIQLKKEQQTMTRPEFMEELERAQKVRHHSWQFVAWARILAENKVKLRDDMKSFRQVFKAQVRKRREAKRGILRRLTQQ
jgi:hypothetical protein